MRGYGKDEVDAAIARLGDGFRAAAGQSADRRDANHRSEAALAAATLRSMVARETGRDRAEAEEASRELRMRTLGFEEPLTRRQDDAHQEFLVLHNQAVAHAERIATDANEQVAPSREHVQRVAAKPDGYDRLARAQARQVEADARVRAGAVREPARECAQKITDLVTTNAHSVLHRAEDRTRQLRWRQRQPLSVMAEVKELIRPAEAAGDEGAGVDAVDAGVDAVVRVVRVVVRVVDVVDVVDGDAANALAASLEAD